MSPQPIFIRKQQLLTYHLLSIFIFGESYAYFTDLRNCKQVLNSIEIAYPTTGKFRKLYMYWEKGYCERKIPLSHQGSPHVMIIANSWTLLTSWVVLDATIKGASRSYNIKWPSHFISCDFLLSELNCSFRLATLADTQCQCHLSCKARKFQHSC